MFETRYHWLLYFFGPLGIFLIILTLGWFLIAVAISFPFLYITRNISEFVVTNKLAPLPVGMLMHYNFVRIHQTLKIAPAMAAGVTQKLWEMSDMVKVLEDWETQS